MKSYVYRVELEEEDDGRWSAVVPALIGCAAWGYSAEEALNAVKDAAQMYVEVLAEHGEAIPTDQDVTAGVIDGHALLVSVDLTPEHLAKDVTVV
jgi:predicted RNase H-like HicB family nuclease